MADSRYQQWASQQAPNATIMVAEVPAHVSPGGGKDASAGGEERLSIPRRVYDGAILAIVAMSAVALYQHLTGSISEVRQELNLRARQDAFEEHQKKVGERIQEAQKSEEQTNLFLQRVWEKIREVQKNQEQPVKVLRTGATRPEPQAKAPEEVRREPIHEVPMPPPNQEVRPELIRDVQVPPADSVTTVQDQADLLEQQVRIAQQQRDEMARALRQARQGQTAWPYAGGRQGVFDMRPPP